MPGQRQERPSHGDQRPPRPPCHAPLEPPAPPSVPPCAVVLPGAASPSDWSVLLPPRSRQVQRQGATPYLVLSGTVRPGQSRDATSGYATVDRGGGGGLGGDVSPPPSLGGSTSPLLGNAKVRQQSGRAGSVGRAGGVRARKSAVPPCGQWAGISTLCKGNNSPWFDVSRIASLRYHRLCVPRSGGSDAGSEEAARGWHDQHGAAAGQGAQARLAGGRRPRRCCARPAACSKAV